MRGACSQLQPLPDTRDAAGECQSGRMAGTSGPESISGPMLPISIEDEVIFQSIPHYNATMKRRLKNLLVLLSLLAFVGTMTLWALGIAGIGYTYTPPLVGEWGFAIGT